MVGDWIKLHRKSLDSAVFSDPWLWHLWSWCLLKANYKDGFFQTEPVKRGQFVTGRESGAKALRVSEAKWYRGMKKLESIGNITLKSNNRFTIVTICNYETYQLADMAERTTGEQQANNGRTTGEQQANTIEERKELKEGKKEKKEGAVARSVFVIPSVEEIRQYCQERSNQVDPDQFSDYYAARGWELSKGRKMKDWRAAVRTWEKNGYTTSNGKPKHETFEEWEKRAERIWAEQDAKKVCDGEQ